MPAVVGLLKSWRDDWLIDWLFPIIVQGKPAVFITQYANLTIDPVEELRVLQSVPVSWSTTKSPRRCSKATWSFNLFYFCVLRSFFRGSNHVNNMVNFCGYCYNIYEAKDEGHDWAYKKCIWNDGWRQAEWDVGRPDIWEAENADWFYGCSEPSQNFPCKEIPSLYCKHIDQLICPHPEENLGIDVEDTALDYSKSVYLRLIIVEHQKKIADIFFRNVQLKVHWEIKEPWSYKPLYWPLVDAIVIFVPMQLVQLWSQMVSFTSKLVADWINSGQGWVYFI